MAYLCIITKSKIMKIQNQNDAFSCLAAVNGFVTLRETEQSGKVPGLNKMKARELTNNSTPEECEAWLTSLGVTVEQIEKCTVSGGIVYFNA